VGNGFKPQYVVSVKRTDGHLAYFFQVQHKEWFSVARGIFILPAGAPSEPSGGEKLSCQTSGSMLIFGMLPRRTVSPTAEPDPLHFLSC
jgi:hypothetical protein